MKLYCFVTLWSFSRIGEFGVNFITKIRRDLEFGVLTIFLGEPDSDHLLEKSFPVNHIAGRKPTEFLFGRFSKTTMSTSSLTTAM